MSRVSQPPASSTSHRRPNFAFRSLLRSLVGIELDEEARQAGERLRQRLVVVAPELLPWLPLLAIPFDVTVDATQETEQLEPAFRKARLHQVVTDFMAKLLPRPALMAFEDVHWMDEASSDLLRHLVEGVSSMPWLICATRRPQDTGFSAAEDLRSVTVRLEPLAPVACTALARAATEEMLLPQHEVAVLAERAGGNPLFLRELVGVATAPGGLEALPGTIEAAITARIDKLAPRERTFLRYASVVGPSFSLDLLGTILASEIPDVADAAVWDRLAEFVDPDAPGSFRFRHASFREVAYEGLPYRRRRDLHERVGEVLERQHAGSPDEHAELLSLHFYRAQDYQKAWRYSLIAGERAHAKFANVEAAGFYRRGLDASRHLGDVDPGEVAHVSEALGDVCELAGLYAGAAGAYRNARRLAHGNGTAKARLLRKEGVIRERLGRYTQALRCYSRGLRCIDAVGPAGSGAESRARLNLAYAGVRYRQGLYAECVRWCHRAVRDAEAINDRPSLAHAYYLLDAAYTDLGKPESARFRALALPIYEEIGDLVGQANVLNNLGIDAYYEGKWDESLALYQRSREAREKAGDVVGAATAANNIGEILSDQGRLAEAEALFREALRVWRAARYPVGVALATSNLGRAAARGGRLDEASRLLSDALLGFREIGAESFVLETEARVAENLIIGGDHVTALPLLTGALGRAMKMGGMNVLLAMLHRLRGYALLQAADPGPAESSLEGSLRLGRSAGAEYEVALTLQAYAHLARLTGRGSEADYLAESQDILRRLGVVSTAPIPLPE